MTVKPSQKVFLGILREMDHPTVLDFGSKTGDFWDLAEKYANIFGCDLALHPAMEERIKNNPSKFRISRDPESIPFDESSFDLIFANSVFEHVEPLASIVKECARVLKPGGRLITVFPTRSVIREPHIHVPFASRMKPGPRRQSWIKACYRFGFGKRYVSKRGGIEAASVIAENYLSDATYYRPYADHLAVLRRYFSEVNDRTAMLIAARGMPNVPGLAHLVSRFYAVCFDAKK